MVAWGDLNSDLDAISKAQNETELTNATNAAFNNLENDSKYDSVTNKKEIIDGYRSQIGSGSAAAGTDSDGDKSGDAKSSEQTEEEKAAAQKKVDDAQAKLDKAKETEQSTANRMLGGLTTLATGIGGMQLAQGIAEKKADSAADKDMDAYIATMRCTYGDGKSVPFGTEPVQLPYDTQSEFITYRNDYIKLANDLKERKTALDMKPGIESEEIIDRAGLYDDENTGITGGHYASRYRAATGSEQDQKGLSSDKKEAKNRMIAGGVIAGVGVVGGIVGNSIINGKLGELIKESRANKAKSKDHDSTVKSIKQALKDKGYTNVDDLNFDNVDVGALKDADWSKLQNATEGKRDAKSLISTANATSLTSSLKDLGVQGSED